MADEVDQCIGLRFYYWLYTGCPKLNDPILKSSTNETIAEKVVKFCVVHNEIMRICLGL